MIPTTRTMHTLPWRRPTDAGEAGTVNDREPAGSQIALLYLPGRDRLLRADRRARTLRAKAHLAAERTDARRRAGHHAPPLQAQRRLGPARALTHAAAAAHHSRQTRRWAPRRPGHGPPARCEHSSGPPFLRPGSRWLPSPMFADQAAMPLQGRAAPFPSQARFRAAAWPAVRALSTTGSPQGGNQR
jgi:hypothetical protein